MQAGRGGPNVFHPDFVSAEAIVSMHARYPERLRGIKTYVESGGWSQGWGEPFLQRAMQAAEQTGLPVYIHTGELLAVDEANRPDPDQVMPAILAAARPGDILGHCYSGMPDGVLGRHRRPTADLRSVVEAGVLLDVGHGLNFSFETARRMIDGGLLPDIISSDVHCALVGVHDESPLTWSLVGTMSKLLAVGVPLEKVIEASTAAPAAVIGMADDIGTLAPGTRADITILEELEGEVGVRRLVGRSADDSSAPGPHHRRSRRSADHTDPPTPPRRSAECGARRARRRSVRLGVTRCWRRRPLPSSSRLRSTG